MIINRIKYQNNNNNYRDRQIGKIMRVDNNNKYVYNLLEIVIH